ncbi:MAG: ribonuclease HII [Tissierellia bacterium]|nr:ribonuclease HII [Tissierellia bacterium]
MMFYELEKQFLKRKIKYVIGIDEVGRGCLAGDVVACAVCIDMENILEGVKDSKKLSPKKREAMSEKILENVVAFSIGRQSAQIIDKINIRQATLRAMKSALDSCLIDLHKKGIEPHIVLVDAEKIESKIPLISIKHGDELSYAIGCASIVAKVHRDNLCLDWDEIYPEYGIKQHKGYGTKAHRQALIKYGPSPIHRRSFLTNMEKWKNE